MVSLATATFGAGAMTQEMGARRVVDSEDVLVVSRRHHGSKQRAVLVVGSSFDDYSPEASSSHQRCALYSGEPCTEQQPCCFRCVSSHDEKMSPWSVATRNNIVWRD